MPEFLRRLICNLVPNKKIRRLLKYKLMPEKREDYKHFASILEEKCQEFKQKSKTIETLVLGASRAEYNILPFILNPNTFNMGISSIGLFEDYHIFKKLLGAMPQIKNLILVLSFYNGASCLVYTKNCWECLFLKKYFDIPYDFSLNKKYNLNKIYKRIQKIKTMKGIRTVGGYDFTGITYAKEKQGDCQAVATKHVHLFESFNNQWIYLEKIAALCKQNQIKLQVVITPTRSDYNKVCQDLGYSHKKLYAPLHKICQQLEIKVLDFSKGFENDDFYDGAHLNFSGALKLTNRLKEKI